MLDWFERPFPRRALLLLILLLASGLRLTGIDWDDYHHYHPDERYISWVATTIERPSSLATALNPTQTSWNPFYWPPDAASRGIEVLQDEHRDFAYGHLPLYLGVLATRLAEAVGPWLAPQLPDPWLLRQDILNNRELIEFRHLTAVARALTALVDVGTVLLVYFLGKAVFRPAVGLLAAAFLAVNVMHIQLAHFFIADPYLSFFVVAAVLMMVCSYTVGRSLHPVYWLLAVVCIGLATGSKFAAVLLLAPLLVTAVLSGVRHWERWFVLGGVVAFVTFFLTNPFAILDLTCDVPTTAVQIGPVTIPAINWGSCYLENIVTQGAMVRGQTDIAFVRQYHGTRPFLYPLEMQLRWGMGLPLGLLAFAGFGWAIWRGGKPIWQLVNAALAQRSARREQVGFLATLSTVFSGWSAHSRDIDWRSSAPQLILLAWTVPFFLTTGSFTVKFMRYLQPLTPFLMLYGAAWLLQWRSVGGRWLVGTAVFLFTTLYALSFVNMYGQPHPWLAASEWIYANVESGTQLLSEQWDDSLPSTLALPEGTRRRAEYPNAELSWLSGTGAQDDAEKLAENLALLAESEYVTVLSNRIYGVVPRLPERYPLSSQYHQLLFDGSLGYELVFVSGRSPSLFGWRIWPDRFGWPGLTPPPAVADYLAVQPTLNLGRADESFTVYDQPLTMIFRNTGRKTAVEMARLFEDP